MIFFKIIFILLLCVPVGYILLRLLNDLGDDARSASARSDAGRRSGSVTDRTSAAKINRDKYRNKTFRGTDAGSSNRGRSSSEEYYTAPKSSGYRGYKNGGGRRSR